MKSGWGCDQLRNQRYTDEICARELRLSSCESDELVGLSSYLFIPPQYYTTPLFIFV